MKGICGSETRDKQRDFQAIISHHLTVVRNIRRKHGWVHQKYLYIDAFAGPGIYSYRQQTIQGSPVIFFNAARLTSLRWAMVAIENDPDNFNNLSLSLPPSLNYSLVNDDNLTWLKQLSTRVDSSNTFGMLYCDPPNTEDTIEGSFELMERMAQLYEKVDLMVYISPTTLKRIRTSKDSVKSLIDRMDPIKKEYWAIREMRGKHQWTFLIGTNYIKWADWRALGIHPVNSPAGREILKRANYTKSELKKSVQPPLTGLMQNTSSTPNFELSERKPSTEPVVSVKSAVANLLRKFTI